MKDIKDKIDESIERDSDSAVDIEILDGNEPAGEAAGAEARTDETDGAPTEETSDQTEDGCDVEPADPEAESEDLADEAEPENEKASFGKEKKKKRSARILEKELEKAATAAAEITDRYQRLMAEFENARKRMDKEKGQMFDIGAKSVLEKLLPVVDNFERGMDGLSEEAREDPFVQGIEKIYQQMMTVLTDVGVTPIEAVGKEFNPDLHNAVMHVEDEELGENVVAQEFQKGYMYKESVLRYSMVKVAN